MPGPLGAGAVSIAAHLRAQDQRPARDAAGEIGCLRCHLVALLRPWEDWVEGAIDSPCSG